MELLRRVALLVAAALFCWLCFSVSSLPLVGVAAVDFYSEQERHGGLIPNDAARTARKLSPEAFREKLIREAEAVNSEECARFAAHAARASAQGGAGMADRLGSDQSGTSAPLIFFSADEPPKGCLSSLPDTGASVMLRTQDEQVPLVKAQRFPVDPGEFQLGVGYARYPNPPASLLYPRRGLAWITLVLGMVAYFALPRQHPGPNEVSYAAGRVTVADVLGIGVFLLFFCLPLLIAGGTSAAISYAWPLLVVLWFLSGFGAGILGLNASYASFRLRAEEDGLCLFGLFGKRRLPYAAIRGVFVEKKRPPVLLRRALWLAAILGGGPAITGMAMMQSSSAPLRLRIDVADGRQETAWLTDQTGTPLLKGLRPFLSALDQAGVYGAEESLVRLFGVSGLKDE